MKLSTSKKTLNKKGFEEHAKNLWHHRDKPNVRLEFDRFDSWSVWRLCETCNFWHGLNKSGFATSHARLQDALRDWKRA